MGSDSRRQTLEQQAKEFAGRRVRVCICEGCHQPFLAPRLAKWCSGACKMTTRRDR